MNRKYLNMKQSKLLEIFLIIKSRSVGLYPYAASLLIKESLKQKIQHSHLSQAVLNFLRVESGVHANDKLWTLRAAEKM